MRIIVLDGYTLNPGDNPWDGVAKLGELTVHDRTPPAQIVERARDAEIILTNKTPLTTATLAQLPKLNFIAVLATGYNVVDVATAKQRGIPVSNVPVYGTDSVAQFTFALLLELCHGIGHHSDAVRAGKWGAQPDFCFWDTVQVELVGKTIAVIGYGRIGRRVGDIARAFGMEVLPFDVGQTNLPDIIARADVVTLHCPLTAENTGMVNREFLGRMKSSAFLINASRGPLVAEQDLADALNAGKIAGAALDVVSTEPIKSDNPLLKARNCLLTPHIAWASLAGRKRLTQTTAENIAAFQAGKPINVVN